MTICAGFKCLDGIVMCADTEETGAGFKRRVPKLEVRPIKPSEQDTCRVVYTGAGESSFVDALIEELWESVPKGKIVPVDEIVGRMKSAVTKYYSKVWSIYPKQMDRRQLPWAELMFAVWSPNGASRLCLARGHDVTTVNTYATIGCGYELSQYICDPLFNPALSAQIILLLAVFMLEEVKQHVADCGGESHVHILGNDGSLNLVSPVDAQFISSHIAQFRLATQHLPMAYANDVLTDEQFADLTQMVYQQLLLVRKQTKTNRTEFWKNVEKSVQKIQQIGADMLRQSASRKSKGQR